MTNERAQGLRLMDVCGSPMVFYEYPTTPLAASQSSSRSNELQSVVEIRYLRDRNYLCPRHSLKPADKNQFAGPPVQPFRLLDLPCEIRDAIFGFCVPGVPFMCFGDTCPNEGDNHITRFEFPLVAVSHQVRVEAIEALRRHNWYIPDEQSLLLLYMRIIRPCPSPSFSVSQVTLNETLFWWKHGQINIGCQVGYCDTEIRPPQAMDPVELRHTRLRETIEKFELKLPGLKHANLEISGCRRAAQTYINTLQALLGGTFKKLQSFKVVREPRCDCMPSYKCTCYLGNQDERCEECSDRCMDCYKVGLAGICEEHAAERAEHHTLRDAGDRKLEDMVHRILQSRREENNRYAEDE